MATTFPVKITGFDNGVRNIKKAEKKKYPFVLSVKGTEIHCLLIAKDSASPTNLKKAIFEQFDLAPGLSRPEQDKLHFGKASKSGIKWSIYLNQNFHDTVISNINSTMMTSFAAYLGTVKQNISFLPLPTTQTDTTTTTTTTTTDPEPTPDTTPLSPQSLILQGLLQKGLPKTEDRISEINEDIVTFMNAIYDNLSIKEVDVDAVTDRAAKSLYDSMEKTFNHPDMEKSLSTMLTVKTEADFTKAKEDMRNLVKGIAREYENSSLSKMDSSVLDGIKIKENGDAIIAGWKKLFPIG